MMTKKPKCANPNCENDGWVLVGDEYYCGECVAKFNNKQNEKLKQQILEDVNGS